MKLHWQKTPFTWIASKTPFENKSGFVVEENKNPPNDILALTTELLKHGFLQKRM